MAKGRSMYKSEKRKKELKRQKKKEEKMQKRLHRNEGGGQALDTETAETSASDTDNAPESG